MSYIWQVQQKEQETTTNKKTDLRHGCESHGQCLSNHNASLQGYTKCDVVASKLLIGGSNKLFAAGNNSNNKPADTAIACNNKLLAAGNNLNNKLFIADSNKLFAAGNNSNNKPADTAIACTCNNKPADTAHNNHNKPSADHARHNNNRTILLSKETTIKQPVVEKNDNLVKTSKTSQVSPPPNKSPETFSHNKLFAAGNNKPASFGIVVVVV